MSNWQFLTSSRQKRKILPWSSIGLKERELEAGDYLLSWQRNGFGRRYVAFIDRDETITLAEGAKLNILDQFYSDGREGNLNLYTVLA
jgi:hypothetical protein